MKPPLERLRELADRFKKQANLPETTVESMKKVIEAAKMAGKEVKSKKE